MNLKEKLEARYVPEPNSGCWLWDGTTRANGYGCLRMNGKQQAAHRLSYELYLGPIQDGLVLDHLCRIRCCVNPAHLEPVSQKENCMRGDTGKHWADKTHCPHGHEYTKSNTAVKSGRRHCRECAREYARAYRARNPNKIAKY